ncbi:unnamed protein product [Symbiodinium natans]|uniref:Uncharacterized protein n=1 Tax=Symbiodinium natans TaxID=878477 RepID=A0A812UMB5_9DINO|nr:unnamed protein product [Symbiodinium natans]
MKGQPVVLKVAAGKHGDFQISTKVVNILRFTASSHPDAGLAPFDALVVKPGMSTLMAGPESMMEAEVTVSHGLRDARKWLVSNGKLIITGPIFEISCVRAAE